MVFVNEAKNSATFGNQTKGAATFVDESLQSYFLKEDGDFLLLESSDYIVIAGGRNIEDYTDESKNSATFADESKNTGVFSNEPKH